MPRPRRRLTTRLLAVLAIAGAVVAVAASPAAAHASLESSDPAADAALDQAPRAITLRFSESVHAQPSAVRLYDRSGTRLDTGPPEQPSGDAVRVAVRDDLRRGTYIVTWRVQSADSHPAQGSFTFGVGQPPSGSATGVAGRLLGAQGGSDVVGLLWGVTRWVVFASLALLVGGAVFLAAVWPPARDRARARAVVAIGWAGTFVGTAVGLLIYGPYAFALPLGDLLHAGVLGDTLDTRFGKVWLARLVLLVLALPLLRLLLRRPAAEFPLPQWWPPAAAAVGVALVATPGLSGHAATGSHVGLALVGDALHVGAMAVWLGGVVVLAAAVLPGATDDEARTPVMDFSRLGLPLVAIIAATGVLQAWHRLGAFDDLRDTDYGRLLVGKVMVFAVLLVVAAVTRELVLRLWVAAPAVDVERVPVGVGGAGAGLGEGAGPGEPGGDGPAGARAPMGAGGDPDADADLRLLRRTVWAEVVLAAAILALTALLVNAAPPARAGEVGAGVPGVTLRDDAVVVDVTVVPGVAGPNDVHVDVRRPDGAPLDVVAMRVTFDLPALGISPLDVPLRRLGPGHYLSPGFDVTPPGTWRVTARPSLTETDQRVLAGTLDIR